MTMGPEELAAIVRRARTIAVLGLSPDPSRTSHQVARYLQQAGYRILPVNPAGGRILGEEAHPDLQAARDAAGPLDIVNVFRRSEALPGHLADLLAVRPGLVWMQVGVRHPGVAASLERAGIPVVMDRCLMVEHPSLVAA